MSRYRVWLIDRELQSVEIDAMSQVDARHKVEGMLDEGTLFEHVDMAVTEGSWEVNNVEPVL